MEGVQLTALALLVLFGANWVLYSCLWLHDRYSKQTTTTRASPGAPGEPVNNGIEGERRPSNAAAGRVGAIVPSGKGGAVATKPDQKAGAASGGGGGGGGAGHGKVLSEPLSRTITSVRAFSGEVSRLGLMVTFAYMCEHHPPFAHSKKAHDMDMFWCVTVLLLVSSVLNVRKSKGGDVLNREQTEEWKGWMQFMFLMYHYFSAHEVYNSIRVFITAYVWMTGFGNFSFFYLKDGQQSLLSMSADLPAMDIPPSQEVGLATTPDRFKATQSARWGRDPSSLVPALKRHPSITPEDGSRGATSPPPPGGPATPALGRVSLESGGVPAGGDEKQEIDGEAGGPLPSAAVEGGVGGINRGGDGGAGDFDEEAGVVEGGSVGHEKKAGDDVMEVLLDAGDALTAKEALLQFAGVCQAFVGCRMSPDQKRQLVHLISDNNPEARTLAVGDGANDVPMIQAAHVGIGISGQEGLQAVNASDYSLAQFRFLQKLLLCHGRFNYRRMSFASSYLFYKSVSWAVPLFLYAFWNGLSGQVFYDWVNSTLWALLYTGLPIVLLGIYDTDVLPETALRYPWLYRNGVDDELLTKKFFWGWIAQGVLESCWVTIPLMFLQTGGPEFSGETPSVLGFGHTAFQAMTLVVNMKIAFVQKRWHWLEAAILTISTALVYGISWFLNASTFVVRLHWEWYGMQSALFKDPNYWAVTMFGVFGVLMRDVAWKGYHRWWHPKLHHVLVEMEKGHLKDIDLPRSLRRTYSLQQVVQEDTSSRVFKMRTQSIRRLEDHRDAVIQALEASGSGTRGYQSSPLGSALPEVAAVDDARRRLDAVMEGGGRPKSAGGRLTSISSLLEGLGRSPMSWQPPPGSQVRGRSAGSSPVPRGLPRGSPASALPSARGADGLVVRYRSSGDLEGLGIVGKPMLVSPRGKGYAFSHDEACSDRQIQMIMRNRRPALARRRSLLPPSKLPAIDDSFQDELRTLKERKAAKAAEGGTVGVGGRGSGSGSGVGGLLSSRDDEGDADALVTAAAGGADGRPGDGGGSSSGHNGESLPAIGEGVVVDPASAPSAKSADTAVTARSSCEAGSDADGGKGAAAAAIATATAAGGAGEAVSGAKVRDGRTQRGSSLVADAFRAVLGGDNVASNDSGAEGDSGEGRSEDSCSSSSGMSPSLRRYPHPERLPWLKHRKGFSDQTE